MNIVLLSGGSGKRLWPLSNDIRSKQFIKFFKAEDGEYESMVQRIYKQICRVDKNAVVTIATSKTQISTIRNQLGDKVSLSIEPCRRDTFPAIALATAYLHDIQGVSEEESVVICPVDPYVDDDYFGALKELCELADLGSCNLALLGMEPTYPSENFGYIMPSDKEKVSNVVTFKEKPNKQKAEEYIEQGALWNGGVFAYKIKYVLEKAHELIEFADYHDLYDKYETLEKISFDYAVVEKEDRIKVMRFNGQWKDLGTWNALADTMQDKNVGDAIINETCEDVYVINELDVPILCMGLKEMVVSASPEGILVTSKEEASNIKPYVDKIEQHIRFAEKSWGEFRVLDVAEGSMTIRVTLYPGQRMNYHSHERRDEIWSIVSGSGKTIVDGMEQPVKVGDVITIEAGCCHTIIAETELRIIEVQLGKEISVHDKQKYEFPE